MKLVYSALFVCQLALQTYLMQLYSTSPVLSVAVLAFLLAAIQTVVAFLVIVSAQVNPPYTMPKSLVAKSLGMFSNSGLFTLAGSVLIFWIASMIPGVFATTQYVYLLGSSVIGGSALNGLFAKRLSVAHRA